MQDAADDTEWGTKDWENILVRIKYGTCTPFLGAGACSGVLPVGQTIAKEWSKYYGFPFGECDDLARVAQFVALKARDPMSPKYYIKGLFEKAGLPDFEKDDEPHIVLATLPLPVYITTNYDHFMVAALQKKGKVPSPMLCRWNKVISKQPSIFEQEPGFDPDDKRPIVFHLHGHIGAPASLVLTEDDYLDFLVNISKDQELIPARIQQAFRESLLLFLGYSLTDWDFRVLFRSLAGYVEKSVSPTHVSVQLLPVGDQVSDKKKRSVQDYLIRYFGDLHVRVYWGTCRKFALELKQQWEAFSRDQ